MTGLSSGLIGLRVTGLEFLDSKDLGQPFLQEGLRFRVRYW